VREEDRLHRIEERLGRVEQEIATMRGDMKLLCWMIGFNLGLSAAILIKLLV
jgi:hypothetical protein